MEIDFVTRSIRVKDEKIPQLVVITNSENKKKIDRIGLQFSLLFLIFKKA